MKTLTPIEYIKLAKENGFYPVISSAQVNQLTARFGVEKPKWLLKPTYKVDIGEYDFGIYEGQSTDTPTTTPTEIEAKMETNQSVPASNIKIFSNEHTKISFVPEKKSTYVPWGNFTKIEKFIRSKKFFPIYVSGLSGNGKTFSLQQVCARNKREFFRVNITETTDEDDLLGGFRLVNGETVFVYGPVLDAMVRGAVLLLDEIDLGTQKIMCLQPVLEGEPVFVKKINKWVYPKDGFQVLATGNTKGLGDDTSGKFIGTGVMNEAMLERFAMNLEQDYPPRDVEKKILDKSFEEHGVQPDDRVRNALLEWAENTRSSYKAGASEYMITTRRLVLIVRHLAIYGDVMEAITDAVTRFDTATKESFIQLFKSVLPPEPGTVPDIGASDKKIVDEDGYSPFSV